VADSFEEFLSLLYPGDESYRYVEELPVFQAVERGELKSVQNYLADRGKIDCRNRSGQTLLMCAARSRWPKIVALLIEHGAQLDAIDADECTPMYHAAVGQSHDSVQLLLNAGANPHYCDDRGRTLVKLLDERSYFRIARTLEKHLARR
jgi:ankyrin repeat protein